MGRNREVELKLELEDEGVHALRSHPCLGGAPSKSADQLSIYYDTADGAVRHAGYSLRVRQVGSRYIQTVKRSAGNSAGLFDRAEWEKDTGGLDVDFDAASETPLGEILTKKLRKRLKPLIRVEAHRATWNLEQDGSRVELILDQGAVIVGDARQSLTEIELELKDGDPASLFRICRELGQAVPMRLGVLTKAERGYRLAEGLADKPAKADPIALRADMSTAEGFAAIAYACLRQFRLNEPLILANNDPVALHQARVATRRLRSAFSLFRQVIVDERFQKIREGVRWFSDPLGDARNLDVLLKRFAAPGGKEAGEALLHALQLQREAAYRQVGERLRRGRLRRLMLDLAAWIEIGEWRTRSSRAALPLPQFANLQLDKRWKKVRKGGRNLARLDPEVRHRLRIEVKKLRYAVEFFASLLREQGSLDRQKHFLHALEEMQEALGELNDLETARTLLGKLFGEQADSMALLRYANRKLEASGFGRSQLEAAQKAHVELVEVGRFWR